ncbi:GTP pyrophosphokinase [Microvirgula sp. AG722]|uniref:RelA/SpoT family protein n=1 Tax=Microvirgula sp. AG722 TaxID=2183901 RepID=UPI000DC57B00|nr:bifunctional (p)ppGpp synthetase/guanosine-3',5'-bis(diphosphate) 3'-pyrophosphohydrolase [Microvirgula sp. AG722]RAS19742.1 GTP pyrophosphokinase [Microvirgula sp. AG722]
MVSVTRPLADSLADAADPNAWLAGVKSGLSPDELVVLERAFRAARELYAGKIIPLTGEDAFGHAVSSAAIIADLNLPASTIAATLLAGAPQYRDDCLPWLTREFGKEIADLVDGVGRLSRIAELGRRDEHVSPEARSQQAEVMRKMLLAMVADIRIVLIKLAWRTQTMHWLSKVADERSRRLIAQETYDIFAPLANRLGVWQIKWELEDLAFRHLEPDNYKKIARLLDERRVERIQYIEDVLSTLRQELQKAGITHSDVAGRPKHIYSIWKKMRKKHLDFSELYDIRAVRVLVDRTVDCYTVLGLIHSIWQPIPGEFDDYISHPKANDYKSLHTAVIGPQDKVVEVQIRTFDMHEHAEFGVAAHWRYKEGGQGDAQYEAKIAWLRQLLDWREEVGEKEEGLANAFQTALFSDTIYVMTPQGRVLSLPAGATPIDFAYAVHSDLGHRCRGAKIDGQIVPLSTPLENGQRIEIMTVKEGGPSINWLHDGWVKSSKAIGKIRQYIRQQNAHVAIDAGRTLFEKELSKLPPAVNPNIEAVADRLNFAHPEEMYAALGHGELSMRAVQNAINAFVPVTPGEMAPEDLVHKSRAEHDAGGILIEGVDNLMTVLAKCCKPAPPDPVVGFVTRGRGVSIHRANCVTLKRLSASVPERLIAADWGRQEGSVFAIDLEVMAMDRPGLLRDISDVLSREKLNVTAVNTLSRDHHARMRFTLEVRQVADLQRVLARVQDVPGVLEARRV